MIGVIGLCLSLGNATKVVSQGIGNKQKPTTNSSGYPFPANLPSDPQAALSQLSQRNRPLQTEHTPAAQHQLLHAAASSGSPTPPPSAAAPSQRPSPEAPSLGAQNASGPLRRHGRRSRPAIFLRPGGSASPVPMATPLRRLAEGGGRGEGGGGRNE